MEDGKQNNNTKYEDEDEDGKKNNNNKDEDEDEEK